MSEIKPGSGCPVCKRWTTYCICNEDILFSRLRLIIEERYRLKTVAFQAQEMAKEQMAEVADLRSRLAAALKVIEIVRHPLFSAEDHKDWRRYQAALAAFDAANKPAAGEGET